MGTYDEVSIVTYPQTAHHSRLGVEYASYNKSNKVP